MRDPLHAKAHSTAAHPRVLESTQLEDTHNGKWPVWVRVVFIVSVSVALWTLIIKSALLLFS